MNEPFAVYHNPVPPTMTTINHYAHFDTKADAEEWSKAYPHEGQTISQAPRGDWVIKWTTEDKA